MTDMLLPISWPVFPFLPLAKPNRTIGVLYIPNRERVTGEVRPIVYLVNMLDIKGKYDTETKFLAECPKEIYENFDTLKAEWRID